MCLCNYTPSLAMPNCYVAEQDKQKDKDEKRQRQSRFVHICFIWKVEPKHVLKMFRPDQRQLFLYYWQNLSLSLSLSCLFISVFKMFKMFRLDQKQLFSDYWRNLKPKQTFAHVPPALPMEPLPSQWRPISGIGDKENRKTLTSLCFHPI